MDCKIPELQKVFQVDAGSEVQQSNVQSNSKVRTAFRLTPVSGTPPRSGIRLSKWTRLTERAADRLGICLSALCLVHCLLTPFLFILLPSIQFLTIHESYHEIMVVVLPLLAIAAFIPGYRLHRSPRVFYWSLPGLTLIVLGATVFHESTGLEITASVVGSLCLIRAHFLNRRYCSCCETGHVRPRSVALDRLLSVPTKRRPL